MKKIETDFEKCISAIMGLVVGDALGVPVEFKSREWIKKDPVTNMRGYGTHDQPPGTWSDDSSMTIATLEWLSETKENQPDYPTLMEKFYSWIRYGYYTPYGTSFDFGYSTYTAILKYRKGVEPLQCGGIQEQDNGNGSLMRILPAALWCRKGLSTREMDGKEFIFDVSSLTHAHTRSKIGCLIYSKVIADLFYADEKNKFDTVEKSILTCKKYFDSIQDEQMQEEVQKYSRLWDVGTFCKLEEAEIKSSGYIVDTLEASIWCFLNTNNYRSCVLKAVNLGGDTDTIGAAAGGLSGLYYGLDAIPEDWLSCIPERIWIMQLAGSLVRK